MNKIESSHAGIDLIRRSTPYFPEFSESPAEPEQSQRLKDVEWKLSMPHIHLSVGPIEKQLDYRVNGYPHFLPAGTFIAEIGVGERATKTITMFEALQGIVSFMDSLDILKNERPDLPIPNFMYGATNFQLATLATRFGFTMMDKGDEESYEVLGFIKNVREKIESFAQEHRIRRLLGRVSAEEYHKLKKELAAFEEMFPTLEDLKASMDADLRP